MSCKLHTKQWGMVFLLDLALVPVHLPKSCHREYQHKRKDEATALAPLLLVPQSHDCFGWQPLQVFARLNPRIELTIFNLN
jgi:hypothetical protein